MKIKATIKDQNDLRIRTSSFQSRRLGDLTDVDTTNLQDGSVLVYNSSTTKFETTITLEKQIINGGNF
mgnify:FL=1|jgi:hypothetical protein